MRLAVESVLGSEVAGCVRVRLGVEAVGGVCAR